MKGNAGNAGNTTLYKPARHFYFYMGLCKPALPALPALPEPERNFLYEGPSMNKTSGLTADDLLWNWARWCWVGDTVGNMQPFESWRETFQPIMVDQAMRVDKMHQTLPHHEQMILIAEYPQKNVRFARLSEIRRRTAARHWIATTTGLLVSDLHYRFYLGLFKDRVRRELT